MVARIFGLAALVALAACSNDPTSVSTTNSSANSTASWASPTTGGTMNQQLDPSMYDRTTRR